MTTTWKHGPLPPETFGFGEVTHGGLKVGRSYADFMGDHARLIGTEYRVPASDVIGYKLLRKDEQP